jgi:two-component system, NarL family, nitrate/nitrite response regulator NarL
LLTRHEREESLKLLREHERAERQRLAPFEELSRREAEILGDLMAGQTVAAIAERSYVSVGTVRTHVRAILRKLDAHSQVQAIGMARDAGWRPPQERVARV